MTGAKIAVSSVLILVVAWVIWVAKAGKPKLDEHLKRGKIE